MRRGTDLHEQRLTLFQRQLLGIVQSCGDVVWIEDDRCGDNRSSKGATSSFVGACYRPMTCFPRHQLQRKIWNDRFEGEKIERRIGGRAS